MSSPSIKALSQEVVNRIAAGEVIHRPSSALKELLENSLDAGSTSISVTSKAGGLKLLQISDNGHGIHRADFPRVCERFATSKLREYEDLSQIETFGFRGEALASISHVAHVSVTSMTADAACAHRASFSDGLLVPPKPGEPAEPRPCAGTRGTTITVEDMFYNVPMRRAAMKGAGEEYAKLLQVVQSYALDNAGVAMSCKKAAEHATELHTLASHSALDVVRLVHGSQVAAELLPLEATDEESELRLHGLISNANFSQKRLTLQLFINKRLVESSHLKRAVEEVYAQYLPKHTHPWVYLSLRLPPASLDVNVHPTKREVHFLQQEEVVGAVQAAIRALLVGANASRTYFTQALLPGDEARARSGLGGSAAGGGDRPPLAARPARGGGGLAGGAGGAPPAAAAGSGSKRAGGKAAPDPRKLVRVNEGMAIGELDKYICRASSSSQAGGAAGGEHDAATPTTEGAKRRRGADDSAEAAVGGGGGGGGGGAGSGSGCEEGGEQGTLLCVAPSVCGGVRLGGEVAADATRPWVPCELTSIHTLLRRVTQGSHRGLTALFRQHVFIGEVDAAYVLLQHQTKLYVVHLGAVSQEHLYQQALLRWGNLARIALSTPAPIAELCVLALRDPRAGWKPADGDPAKIGAAVAKLLGEKAAMLEEYLSIVIRDGAFVALPQLIEGYTPPLNALPLFTLRLASHVDWSAEEPCFDSLARLLASFYRLDRVGAVEEAESEAAATPAAGEAARTPAWTVQHILLPSIRRSYEPPAAQSTDHTVVQVACTEQLYRIFERC